MCISDWSSDVCSSDLGRSGARHDASDLHDPGQSRLRGRSRYGEEIPRRARAATAGDRAVREFALHREAAHRLSLVPQPYLETGRASYRERECLYVSSSVDTASFKKKHIPKNTN